MLPLAPGAAYAELPPEDFESCLFDLINQERAKAGIGALTMTAVVNSQARTWSKWMSENELRHTTDSERAALLPDWDVFTEENIAWNSDPDLEDCKAIHDRLMGGSSQHRANILDGTARFVGLGAHVDRSGW